MIQITPISAFRDNYIWALHDDKNAVVVDPGEAAPVLAFLQAKKLTLTTILITHHHNDHIGGNRELLARFPVPVYGPAGEAIDTLTTRLKENDVITLAEFDLTFKVLDIPGHTAGHIAYVGHGMLFCGDTLFACGCGRLFEGTAAQMHTSLGKLAALPGSTQVYCAHEYTLANIAFARAVEPDNDALLQREFTEREKRGRNVPTVPSTIALELQTNPFMRSDIPAVARAADQRAQTRHATPVEIFATIREWKNSF
jgi:hydroxyacylglutathione hydrolase